MCTYCVIDLTALTISMLSNLLASIYEKKVQTGHHPTRALQAQYQVLIYCNCRKPYGARGLEGWGLGRLG